VFSYDQLHSILSALPDPAFILTRSGRYAALFGGLDHRYYHDGSSLVGLSMFDVLVDDKARWFVGEIEQALRSRSLHIVEYCLSGDDVKGIEEGGPDHTIWFEGRVQALDFPVAGEQAVIWVASNITEKNAIAAELRQQSETDALTGLFNRRKLIEALDAHYKAFSRERRPTSAFMFDIDHFKRINDRFGHPAGDSALLTVAEVCRREMRHTDVLARCGGDEFVVLMPGTDRDTGRLLANRLRLRIASELERTLQYRSTISGGLSEFGPPDTSCEDILRRADDGLYQSKRSGRDRISVL